jgi:LacI family transcriptional regulator
MNLKELAKALNLSISTVSKAMRDSYEISESTKKMVKEKAIELNYQANPFASSLRKQKSKTIALVIPEIANNFFTLAINGVESIAQEKGYHVLIYLTHEDVIKETGIVNILQNGRVDGILISTTSNTSDAKHLEALMQKEIPLVLFDRVIDKIMTPKITTDDYNSGLRATEHLIKQGCKKVAFLSISSDLSICNKRMNGYQDALKNIDSKINQNLLIQCNNDDNFSKNQIRKLLSRKLRPDGIFASVEKLAIMAYEVCEELGIRIPEDVKIISFSNLQTATLLNPSLTTITQPAFEMGREAASILFRLIEKKGSNFILDKTVLKSTLIERNSTRVMNYEL